MKKSGALIIGASIAVAIGVFMVLSSIPTSSNTTTFTLPTGDYYYRFETTTLMSGKVSGTFEVTSGDPVNLMILDQSEFDIYASAGHATPLYETSGNSGSFSGSLSGTGKLFIVFEHQLSTGSTDVTIDYKVSGIAVTFFAIGIALIVIGAVLGLVGTRMRRKEAKALPRSPAATDVTFLNSPPPPSNP